MSLHLTLTLLHQGSKLKKDSEKFFKGIQQLPAWSFNKYWYVDIKTVKFKSLSGTDLGTLKITIITITIITITIIIITIITLLTCQVN